MIIARILGGLGNQLFIYAAARHLSLKNNVPLKLDITSGYWLNPYNRLYALMPFNIEADIASPFESYSGLNGKIRRRIDRFISNQKDFEKRYYLKEEIHDFDNRILKLKVKDKIYLDGYWQSEKYFFDIKDQIRKDLIIKTSLDQKIIEFGDKIRSYNSVCIHVRRFDYDTKNTNAHMFTLDTEYYINAMEEIKSKVDNPIFFIFGQQDELLNKKIKSSNNCSFIENNKEFEDLYLMSQCKHAIISNSSFAWWGAWLANNQEKIVITSNPVKFGLNKDCYPESWHILN